MDTIFKSKGYEILELFVDNPQRNFSIREMARQLKINHVTVIRYIKDLLKLNLIKKKTDTLYPTYYANRENNKYKFYKRNLMVFRIKESGLVEFIENKIYPGAIILFGSGAKGDYVKGSDLDIFVEAKEVDLNITKYEKRLKRKIHLIFKSNINNLTKELKNNVVNGYKLSGFIKIK